MFISINEGLSVCEPVRHTLAYAYCLKQLNVSLSSCSRHCFTVSPHHSVSDVNGTRTDSPG